MAKKRTSLDSLFTPSGAAKGEAQTLTLNEQSETISEVIKKPEINRQTKQSTVRHSEVSSKPKSEIVKQTVYLPPAVYEQLRQLAFEERRKMHDYLVEGLDRVFKNRGLKPYAELSDETK